ncbi:MAG: family 10 glycosylhydrolase [Candidatus Gastranaerophilales bacterium]|nr:family 10 glycosylhydrolase [Candidatus Gastranaerophilales bacterium]
MYIKKILPVIISLFMCISVACAQENTPVENSPAVTSNEANVDGNTQTQEKPKKYRFWEEKPRVKKTSPYVVYKEFVISKIDPGDKLRGANELVIFTSLYGETTGTAPNGLEAVIINNRVSKINQYNSFIPKNGFVLSGEGTAKNFINDNLFEGADIEIDFESSKLKVKAIPDNYTYEARARIDKVKDILANSNPDEVNVDNMKFYLKRADDLLYTARKLVKFEDYEDANRLSKDAMLYADMAQYSSAKYIPSEHRGMWVIPLQRSVDEVVQAFDIIQRLDIEHIYIDTTYKGFTVYPSSVMKKAGMPEQLRYYGNFDPIAAWIELAHQNDMKVILSTPTFNAGTPDPSQRQLHISKLHPEWLNTHSKLSKAGEADYYLDPANPEVQRFIIDTAVEMVKKYDVDGINFSYLIYPYSEDADNKQLGYTKYAKEEFHKFTGIDPAKIEPLSEQEHLWKAYKASKITALVRNLKILRQLNKDLLLSVNLYPLAAESSQDYKNWNADKNQIALLPVLTSADDDFAKKIFENINLNVPKETQIYPVYTEPYNDNPPRDFFNQLLVARAQKMDGMIFYDVDSISKTFFDALRLSVLRKPSTKKQDRLYEKPEKK